MPYFLKVLSSPQEGMVGVKLPLAEGETLAGRISPPAQIQLAGTKVSKKHCLFQVKGDSLEVADLKSSNGTFVNGQRVKGTALRERDRLVIGDYVFEVTRGEK